LPLAEVADVRSLRQRRGIDLQRRAHHQDLPFRVGRRQGVEHGDVETLVQDPEEAEPRPWQARLVQ
jgi:hypothetical protein